MPTGRRELRARGDRDPEAAGKQGGRRTGLDKADHDTEQDPDDGYGRSAEEVPRCAGGYHGGSSRARVGKSPLSVTPVVRRCRASHPPSIRAIVEGGPVAAPRPGPEDAGEKAIVWHRHIW